MESKTQDNDDFCIINATRPPTPQHTLEEQPTFLSQLRSNFPPSPEPITRHVQREQQDAYRSYLESMRKKTVSMLQSKPQKPSIKFQDDEDLSSIPPPEPLIANSSIVSLANAFGVTPSMVSVLSTPVVSPYVKAESLISGVLTLPKLPVDNGTYSLQATSNALTLVPAGGSSSSPSYLMNYSVNNQPINAVASSIAWTPIATSSSNIVATTVTNPNDTYTITDAGGKYLVTYNFYVSNISPSIASLIVGHNLSGIPQTGYGYIYVLPTGYTSVSYSYPLTVVGGVNLTPIIQVESGASGINLMNGHMIISRLGPSS